MIFFLIISFLGILYPEKTYKFLKGKKAKEASYEFYVVMNCIVFVLVLSFAAFSLYQLAHSTFRWRGETVQYGFKDIIK